MMIVSFAVDRVSARCVSVRALTKTAAAIVRVVLAKAVAQNVILIQCWTDQFFPGTERLRYEMSDEQWVVAEVAAGILEVKLFAFYLLHHEHPDFPRYVADGRQRLYSCEAILEFKQAHPDLKTLVTELNKARLKRDLPDGVAHKTVPTLRQAFVSGKFAPAGGRS
jgi:hypothetical protein